MEITGYEIRKLTVPCEPSISDSQYEFDTAGVAYLELETDVGETGIGIGGAPSDLLQELLEQRFKRIGADLVGRSPFHLYNRLRRPRGGEHGSSPFDRAVDFALWDLCGKYLDLPLYELLGGRNPAVPTCGSGLAFSHDDQETRAVYEEFASLGIDAAKVKVGYPTVAEDLDRLALVRDVLGEECTLLVDANEAWDPKETIRRAHAYQDAGFDIDVLKDPVLREDVAGYRRVVDNIPFSHVNTGEYVNREGKRRLLENHALDMLNVRNGIFSTAPEEAALATAYGAPIHVGDTHCEIGVHLVAALPEVSYVEYWKRPWDRLMVESVRVEDGHLIAPDRPGHGVTTADDALEEFGE